MSLIDTDLAVEGGWANAVATDESCRLRLTAKKRVNFEFRR